MSFVDGSGIKEGGEWLWWWQLWWLWRGVRLALARVKNITTYSNGAGVYLSRAPPIPEHAGNILSVSFSLHLTFSSHYSIYFSLTALTSCPQDLFTDCEINEL